MSTEGPFRLCSHMGSVVRYQQHNNQLRQMKMSFLPSGSAVLDLCCGCLLYCDLKMRRDCDCFCGMDKALL